MKKLFIILFGISLIFLSGCIDRNRLIGGLTNIQIFDEEGNECVGEFRDYYDEYDYFASMAFQPLNSPATRKFYYCIPAVSQSIYTIRLTITNKNQYVFKQVVDHEGNIYSIDNCTYTLDGSHTILDINTGPITSANTTFSIETIYFTKSTDTTPKTYRGGTTLIIEDEYYEVYGCFFKLN